jgi:hypothetical protein
VSQSGDGGGLAGGDLQELAGLVTWSTPGDGAGIWRGNPREMGRFFGPEKRGHKGELSCDKDKLAESDG